MNSRPTIRNLKVILLALTLLNIPATHGESQTLVLSTFTDNLGVASPSGKHLYATVTEGGTMTYADITEDRIVKSQRVLTTIELSQLREAFHNSQLAALRGTISGGNFHPRDYQMSLEVIILRGQERQQFTLVDYDRAEGQGIPPGAAELLCLVDEVRGSRYRVSQGCK
jgi:hypothetical protein